MNRIVMMVLKNIWIVPKAWFKLCHYAKHTDEYPEEEKYRHIQYILKKAVKGGNVDLQVYCSQISSLISSLIIYLCAFVIFFKAFLQKQLAKSDEKKTAKAANKEGGEG